MPGTSQGMECPPTEVPASIVPFAPAAERTLQLFGTTVHLALLPSRKARSGHVQEGRRALQKSPAERILAEEAYWRTDGLALTPNKYPFARDQRILWMANPAREPDLGFWLAALAWAEASEGTVLLNNIGAAATIPRAHAHLIGEQMGFLAALNERPLTTPVIDLPDGCELVQKDLPFCLIGLRGDVAGKATALMRLADARLTATWNIIATKDAVWIVPRGKQTPTPFFAQAVGAAEFWGRWCYVDQEPFEAATAEDLEQALRIATTARID